VSVFDQWPDGGGVLRYGIPRFKLDHALVSKRLSYLKALGVEFLFNARIGGDRGVDQLFREGFEAIFLGTGTGVPVPIDLPGSSLRGVYQAVPFLVSGNVEQNLRPSDLEDPPVVGKRVVVVGGGDTAVYCGRTAVRMGAERVTCCFSGDEEETSGNPVDRVFAVEEGVTFRWNVSPLRILGDGRGQVARVELAPTVRGRGLHPIETSRTGGSESATFLEPADTVLVAEGFLPDPSLAEETSGLSRDHFGLVVVDPATGRTSRKGVWAGGDNVLGSSLVARAVRQGRIAARDIHERLQAGSP
jgi:glutamate synthase (NADPH/NADH) small chain